MIDRSPPPRAGRAARRPALLLLLAALLALAPAARADEVDLTDSSRPGPRRPGMLALLVCAGSNLSPSGNLGGGISYYNELIEGEVEADAGAGFPGLQYGLNLRKLFGEGGDYFAIELGFGFNSRVLRGVNPGTLGSGAHAWSNLGIGFEHRAGLFLFGVAGGISLTGFNTTPSAYIRASAGVAFF